MAAGPNFHTAITDHRQLDALAIHFAQRVAEIIRRPARPVETHVNADQLFLLRRSLLHSRKTFIALLVLSCFQDLRRLAQSLDYGLRKLLRADLLLADF